MAVVAACYYLSADYTFLYDSLEAATGLCLVGLSLFFVAWTQFVHEQLSLFLSRMGSDRPVSIVRGALGWEADHSRSHFFVTCLGEIDVRYSSAPGHSNDDLEKYAVFSFLDHVTCGCCATSSIQLSGLMRPRSLSSSGTVVGSGGVGVGVASASSSSHLPSSGISSLGTPNTPYSHFNDNDNDVENDPQRGTPGK